MTTLVDVYHARGRTRPYLTPTPLEAAPGLGEAIRLKLECANLTHAFKIRGAINAVLALPADARARGLIASSSGNHAQGLAYAAHLTGTPATILMPKGTPGRKIDGVRRYGAEAVIVDGDYDFAEAEARRIEREQGRTFVSAYNDPFVVAGQGTIGLEIVEQHPDVQRVLVCVSGGGLISGVALALKALKPDVEVIGVGAAAAPAMYNIFYGESLPHSEHTLAEALAGDIEAGSITVPLVQQYVDSIVLVDEAAIAAAMRWAVLEAGWVVEGGGAVGIAALQTGAVPVDGRETVVVVSGGNVDGATLRQVIAG